MTVTVALPALTGPEAELWPLLFELAEEVPDGWAVVGAQMVILHSAAHGVTRPARTEDVDVLVDLRVLRPRDIAEWLTRRGFEVGPVSPDGVGHRFLRDGVKIDVLALDHAGERADKTTVPPARTVSVPGGRSAAARLVTVEMTVGSDTGIVLMPDWVGALVLKARAAVELDGRERHLLDFALLLALPVDALALAKTVSTRQRQHLRRAVELLDDAVWHGLPAGLDARVGRAAARLVCSSELPP